MKPTHHSSLPSASRAGSGVGGAGLGSRVARCGLRFGGMAIVPVEPVIAARRSS